MVRRGASVGLFALLAVGTGTGCSLLGLESPAHKLTFTADEFRKAAGVPPAIPRELNKQLLPAYVVEPGDTLLVLPVQPPVDPDKPPDRGRIQVQLPGDQLVQQDGTIDLSEYGRPVVAGKTLPQIEADIRQLIEARLTEAKIGDGQSAAVDVRLVGRASKVFYVLGEVNAPGSFPLAGRETVLDGILVAGGITRRASTKSIILSRPTQPEGCRVVLPVCYDNIVQLGDTATNYQLQPGDRIFVSSKGTFESLCPDKYRTPVCTGPQTLCPGTGACGPAHDYAPPVPPVGGPTPNK